MSNRKEIKVSTEEAKRQMEIINNLKVIIQQKKQELGRDIYYSLSNYGCQMTPKTVTIESFDNQRYKKSCLKPFLNIIANILLFLPRIILSNTVLKNSFRYDASNPTANFL